MPYIPVGAAEDLAIFHTRRTDIYMGFVRRIRTIFPARSVWPRTPGRRSAGVGENGEFGYRFLTRYVVQWPRAISGKEFPYYVGYF